MTSASSNGKRVAKKIIHVSLGTSRDESCMEPNQSDQPVTACTPDDRRGDAEVCNPSRPSGFIFAVAIIWFVVIVGALGLMANYSHTPGLAGTVPLQWPAGSSIPLDSRQPTLVMFVHPHCPCTQASLGELNVLMSQREGQVSAHIVFVQPAGTTEDWVNTSLWRDASAISGLKLHRDQDGVEAHRFHAETSGYTVLYDRNGKRLFQGGITMSRGHSGDNAGRAAVVALIGGSNPDTSETPVFGCELFDMECRQGGQVRKP